MFTGPYALLIKFGAIVVVLVLVFGGTWRHGYTTGEAKVERDMAAAIKKSEQEAAIKEAEWQDKFNLNARHLTNEINRIATDRDRYVAELRNRPSRADLSEAARAGCEGANGIELAREYAEFLTEFAARATRQDAALASCYAAFDDIAK